MTTELILIGIILTLIFLLLRNFLFSNLHITKEIIERDFDIVWDYFSEPNYYAELFPNWIVSIEKQSNNMYQSIEKHVKNPVKIIIEKNKDCGYIKLNIGKSETSQIRIISLEKNKTLVLNIGYRWKGFLYPFWLNFKRSTDKDYVNAKHVIEKK